MEKPARIPVSWSVRWRYLRQLVLPALAFLGTSAAVLNLWTLQVASTMAPGSVDAPRRSVRVLVAGHLVPLARGNWTLFDTVEANQVIARLDDRPVRASLATLVLEGRQFEAEMLAAEAQYTMDLQRIEQDHLRETARLAWQVEQIRLDVLDRRTAVAADEAELQRLQGQLELMEELGGARTVGPLNFTDIRGQIQVIERRLAESRRSLAEADRQRQQEAKRLADRASPLPEKLDQVLAPLRAELAMHEARLNELTLQIESLEVRAPVAGTICEILSWPGQAVQAGDPIVTIADNVGRFVVSYVRPSQQVSATAGMPVAMRPRRQGAKTVPTAVLRVGPQFEAIPADHRHDPRVPEWGLPVMIELPGELELKPGEIVDVLFTSRSRTAN